MHALGSTCSTRRIILDPEAPGLDPATPATRSASRADYRAAAAIVNLARVRELRRPAQREWFLVLDGGVELPVSRRLRPEIQRQLGRLDETT